jgi:hypothetical protein
MKSAEILIFRQPPPRRSASSLPRPEPLFPDDIAGALAIGACAAMIGSAWFAFMACIIWPVAALF